MPGGTVISGVVKTEVRSNLINSLRASEEITLVVKRSGLIVLGDIVHNFPDSSFTILLCLAESHLAVHTWPDLGEVTIDIHVCDYTRDNSEVCLKVFDFVASLFEPTEVDKQIIRRDQKGEE